MVGTEYLLEMNWDNMISLERRMQEVTRRWRQFFESPGRGHLLVAIRLPTADVPLTPLNQFDLDFQLHDYLDERLAAARAAWLAKAGLDDDTLPAFAPFFGIAEHSAWLGLEVRLQEWTCLPIPVIQKQEDLDRLRPDPASPWFRRMREAYAYCRRRQDGSFFLSVRGTMTPMDLANAVRGDDLFVDFLSEPDFVHTLMERLTEWIPWYYDQLYAWADDVNGGRLFMNGLVWMPNRSLGHISNDATALCATEIYDTFGLPYETVLCRRYRKVLYHVHNRHLHFVPRLASLPNLGMIEVTEDPKTSPTLEELPRILAAVGHSALLIHGESDAVRKHIRELSDCNALLDVACRDREDAEDLIRLVREHSRPFS